MPHSSIEETAPYRLITAAREATSQKQTYQEGSYLIYPTQQIRKRGRTLYSFNIAERRGAAPHSQPSKRATATPQQPAIEKEEAAAIGDFTNKRGRGNRRLHQQKRPRQ